MGGSGNVASSVLVREVGTAFAGLGMAVTVMKANTRRIIATRDAGLSNASRRAEACREAWTLGRVVPALNTMHCR